MVAEILQQQQQTNKEEPVPVSRTNSSQSRDNNRRSVSVKTIGNYSLQQSIGKGSMGKVKLAVHNVTGEKIAIKIVPRANLQQLSTTGKMAQQIAKEKAREENREVRTVREAHIMMLLKHPNIVGMKDLVLQGPYFYILMDYVNGGQLLHYIVKRQRLSDRRTRQFSRQIVSALDYLHRNSIVHRDLKIENIMIDKSGRNIKIIDFGLSNLFCPERQLTTYCGSLYFAAPELLKASPYNGPEVDVWSLGVVIYVMATGSVPFDDKSMPGLHDKIKKGEVTYPTHLSDECKDLLSKIFTVDPMKRIIMTDIIHHPWMNKDLAPINNHMPVRKPLALPLSVPIMEKMPHGFNLGSPEEIEKRLTLIVQSPVYNDAVKHIADCHARKPTTPSSLPKENSYGVVYDDPQSVPAAYHPFLSLYYLCQEKAAAAEHEVHHRRISMKSSLSRKTSVDSLGGNSSARSSQASLVDENLGGARLLTEVPTSHTPVLHIPQTNDSGVRLNFNNSAFGLVSLSAAISSTNYLNRIQRWLRSSLSQHHLSESSNHMNTPPSPPPCSNDSKTLDAESIFNNTTEGNRLPTPSQSTEDKENAQTEPSPSESTHSNINDASTSDQQNRGTTTTAAAGPATRSLFRKISHALLRRNPSKSVLKKDSGLSGTNTSSYINTSDEDKVGVESEIVIGSTIMTTPTIAVVASSNSKSNISQVKDNDMPPPVPPKDPKYVIKASLSRNSLVQSKSNNNSQVSQLLPPGMSMATVTSRQTAHTIDLSAISNTSATSIQTTSPPPLPHHSQSHIPTPIASKMAKYENNPLFAAPSSPANNGGFQPGPMGASKSSSLLGHRRKGSMSSMAGKIGSWLNRSTPVNSKQ